MTPCSFPLVAEFVGIQTFSDAIQNETKEASEKKPGGVRRPRPAQKKECLFSCSLISSSQKKPRSDNWDCFLFLLIFSASSAYSIANRRQSWQTMKIQVVPGPRSRFGLV